MMTLRFFTSLLFALALMWSAAPGQNPAARSKIPNYTGHYAYNLKRGESATLQVIHQGDKVRFFLMAFGSGPAHNMGTSTGEFTLTGTTAVWRQPEPLQGSCTLTFTFYRNRIEVEMNESEGGCGYGHKVTSGGVYYKKNSRRPDPKSWEM